MFTVVKLFFHHITLKDLPIVVVTYMDLRFCFPLSSTDSIPFTMLSMFSAILSASMSLLPTATWKVSLSLERMRIEFLEDFIMSATFYSGVSGTGILPLGPRIAPRVLPISGMYCTSAMKKSHSLAMERARLLSSARSLISSSVKT